MSLIKNMGEQMYCENLEYSGKGGGGNKCWFYQKKSVLLSNPHSQSHQQHEPWSTNEQIHV